MRIGVERWSTDLAIVNEIADGIFPALAGCVVMEDGVGITNDPGVEVAHDWNRRVRADKDV